MAIIADDLPPEDPGARSADGDDLLPGLSGTISWCWDFDFAALLDAVTGPAPWLRATHADCPDDANETNGSAAGKSTCPVVGRSAGPQAGSGAGPVPEESTDPAAEAVAAPAAGEIADPAAESSADPAAGATADPEAEEAAFQDAVAAGRARELRLGVGAARIAAD